MASVKDWVVAARLRTLPLSFASIFAGSAIALKQGVFSWTVFALTLLVTLFLQILSNFANDYGDAHHGADHEERKGPARMVSSGRIPQADMKWAIVVFSILSFLSGLLLLFTAFSKEHLAAALVLLLIGIMAIAAAIKYTVGKSPYGYIGLGDLFVFIFFGLVAVIGTKFLQTKSFALSDFLPAISFGLMAVAVLNVNNMRDMPSDKVAGKNSIPVRLGFRNAKIYHTFLILLPQVFLLYYSSITAASLSEIYYVLVFPLLWMHLAKVWPCEDNHKLDPQLKIVALSSLLISVLFFGVYI